MAETESALPLARLLRPRSVAIVGVSPEPGSLGGAVLDTLERFGYRGDIHLVSRNRREIKGRPCVAAIDDLPEGVDVAVLAVPRAGAAEAVAACIRRKLGGAILFASGFAELDETGAAEQAALAAQAGAAGLALSGPNCLGYVNFVDGIVLTFEHVMPPPALPGPAVGIVAQSGAITGALRMAVQAKGIPVSYSISTGNEAVVGIEDVLAFLIEDEATKVIALFAEQLRRPRLFLELAAAARVRGKPIVLMHPGASVRAQESARSHTGALAGNHAVMQILARREAVVFVETLEELVDAASLLARFPAPPAAGAAIMTVSGAFKGYALDFCETLGLDVPVLDAATVAALRARLPSFASLENPLDMTTQSLREPELLGACAEALLADPHVGSLIAVLMPGPPAIAMARAASLLSVIAEPSKPVALAILGDQAPLLDSYVAAFRDARVPFFRSPERALRAMAHVTAYGAALAARARPGVPLDLPPLSLPGPGVLPEYRGKALLAALDIPVPPGTLARGVEEATGVASRIGYPVVLKAQSSDLAHKSDVGGVILDIADAPALALAWQRLHAAIAGARPGLALEGVLVEKRATPGLEMVVGARRDADWGPVLMVGLGGIWVEALNDIRLLPADLDEAEITGEIARLKAARLLQGGRGRPVLDIPALARTVRRLGAAMRANPSIAEIDINPLIVYPEGQGVLALDALVVIA